MNVHLNLSFEVDFEDDINIDSEKYAEYLNGNEPRLSNLKEYLYTLCLSKMNYYKYELGYNQILTGIDIYNYEELFREVRYIQTKEKDKDS